MDGYYERFNPFDPPIVRFEKQYIPEPNSGCWLWIGSVRGPKSSIRPIFRAYGRMVIAARFSCEHFNGPIPQGMFACHRCHNTYCVNPEHIYAGTPRQNVADMMRAGRHFSQNGNDRAMTSLRARALKNSKAKLLKPTCSKGHELDSKNMYAAPSGRRVCKTCRLVWKKNYRIRAKEARRGQNV